MLGAGKPSTGVGMGEGEGRTGEDGIRNGQRMGLEAVFVQSKSPSWADPPASQWGLALAILLA